MADQDDDARAWDADLRVDAQPPPQPTPQPQDTTAAPDEWADALLPTSDGGRPHADRWKHQAAAALHGWDLHAHHAGQPLRLHRGDYEAALQAATTLQGNTYQPHAAALSEYAPKPAQEGDQR